MAELELGQELNQQTSLPSSSSSHFEEHLLDDALSTQADATHTMDSEQEHSTRSSRSPNGHLISPKSLKPAIRCTKNSINRQLTFSKRCNGLLRKADELSVLCDSEVAIIIYSATGQLFEYATSSIAKIIKRHKDHQPPNTNQVLSQKREYWKDQALLVRQQVEHLNDLQSYIFGVNSINLSYNELRNIETFLESTMDKIQTRKNELREVQTKEMAKKGNNLWIESNLLKRKLEEVLQASGENATSCVTSESGLSISEPPNGNGHEV